MLPPLTITKAIEVLCAKKAYVVKRIGKDPPENAELMCGQLTWSLYDGPVEAWETAKKRAHFQ